VHVVGAAKKATWCGVRVCLCMCHLLFLELFSRRESGLFHSVEKLSNYYHLMTSLLSVF